MLVNFPENLKASNKKHFHKYLVYNLLQKIRYEVYIFMLQYNELIDFFDFNDLFDKLKKIVNGRIC